MTDLLEQTKESWRKEYDSYPATKPEGWETFHASTYAPVAYEIPLGSKVLDLGANDGTFMKLLQDKRDCEVYGLDVSPVAIAEAKKKDIDVTLYDGETIPFEDETFDFVVLMETLNHLHDPQVTLREIRRVLKPSGVLIGSVPHKNLEKYIWEDRRLHRRNFDEPELRDLLEETFPMVHLRILKGAQFAVVHVNSFMAKEPAEMLFKAGNEATSDWESELMAQQESRVWFGPTQLPGTVYYRLLGYADKMDKLGLIEAGYERVGWSQIDENTRRWQANIRNKVILNQLEQILRSSHVSIWQITINRDVLAFLRCARDLANKEWYQATGERKKFITDVDDNLFDIPSYNIASNPYQPNSDAEWIAMEQIKNSDAVICSTQYLVEKIHQVFGNKPTYLIPNSIDFDVWDHLTPDTDIPSKGDKIRIGYTGCANHRGDLELIKDPLCAILTEFKDQVEILYTPQRVLKDEGGFFLGWEGVPNMGMVKKWVDIDKYPNFVAGWDMDIGIAPLTDHDFNRAKSNLRWLEYSALKVPTVASRVYPFKNSIRSGEDGFICNTSQQWYDTLKMLVLDAQKRKEVGAAAYQRIKRDFNMQTMAQRYAGVIEEVRQHESI